MKEVTIYELAKELKVSPSTVSRALQDHHSIGKNTIKAVKDLALKRGYRPNRIAASLRSNKSKTIGVIVPWINRPFISSLISGIEEEANRDGFQVIISQSHDLYENEVANAYTMYNNRVAGLIISLAMDTEQYKHFELFSDHHIPVVFVDRVPQSSNHDMVVVDNFQAGFDATKHLIEQGCKRIAHIGGSQLRNVYHERQSGYLQALKDYRLKVDSQLIVNCQKLSAEEGFQVAKAIMGLQDPPEGVFVANDTVAVSVIQYAKSSGIRIPQDLLVIGFNDDPIASIIEPSLSTISHPASEMGKNAFRQIFRPADDGALIKSQSITLKTHLVVRESTDRIKS